MNNLTNLNIHDVVDIESSTEILHSLGSSFTVTEYRFTDSGGGVITINAFLREGKQDEDE